MGDHFAEDGVLNRGVGLPGLNPRSSQMAKLSQLPSKTPTDTTKLVTADDGGGSLR